MSWKNVKIGKVLRQYRIEHWVQNDKIYKQVSILNDGSVVLRGEKLGKEIGRKRQFIINLDKYPNTLIFTRQLLLQGSIGMASQEVNGCIATENMPMFSAEGINPEFLFFFIKSELFKAQVRNLKTSGTAQKSLHERQFLELKIPLLSEKEQEEVIEKCKLSERNIDEIIEEIENQQSYLQLLRQAILQEAVQGKLTEQDPTDEPAKELLKRIKAEKEKLIKAGKLKKEKELPAITEDEISFELPEEWAWVRLAEVIELISGQHVEAADWNDKKDGYPYLTGPSDFGVTNPIFSRWTKKPKVFAMKDDVLITVKGSGVGKLNLLHEDNVAIGRQLMAVRVKQIKREFVSLFLDGKFHVFQNDKAGIAIPGISREDILDKLFPLPPLAEQQRIVTKVQQLQQQLSQLETQIQQSREYAKQLLQGVLREAFEEKGKVYEENEMITMAAEE